MRRNSKFAISNVSWHLRLWTPLKVRLVFSGLDIQSLHGLIRIVLVAEIQAAIKQSEGRGGTQYSTKRHAQDMSNTDEDTDEGLERMDVDQKNADSPVNGEITDDETRSTPQPLEEGEATTDDEDDSSTGAVESRTENTGHQQALERPNAPRETPPTRRELPFTRRRGSPRTETKPELAGEETAGETDDDEL